MLNAQGQLHQGKSYTSPKQVGADIVAGMSQMQPSRQMDASPYFTKAGQGATLDPRALQMQQYAQMQQAQGQNIQPRQQGAIHPQSSMQSMMQFPAQGMGAIRGGNAMPKVERPVKSSGSASGSDDDLDIEDEEPPETRPAVITIAKPINDERGKLLWEVVDAVWTPKNKPASPDKIRSAVRFVGEAVRSLRDKWKETNDKLKKAENANQPTEGLRVAVGTYREIMETLAGRVTNFGHPSILKRYVSSLPRLPHASTYYAFSRSRNGFQNMQCAVISFAFLSMMFAAHVPVPIMHDEVLACWHASVNLAPFTTIDSSNTYSAAVPQPHISSIS